MSEKTKKIKGPYGFEIAMLKNQTFDPELRKNSRTKLKQQSLLKVLLTFKSVYFDF